MADQPSFIEPPPMAESDDPGCKFYVSIDQPECGKKPVTVVKVRYKAGMVNVELCDEHLAKHNETFARARTGRQQSGTPYLTKHSGRTEI